MARKKTKVRAWICKRLKEADRDWLRSLLQGVIQEWMAQSRCYMSRESIDALIREHVPKTSESLPNVAKAAR